MATLSLDRDKLRHNHALLERCIPAGVSWGVVTKLLCGDERFLEEVLALGPRQLLDARLENLETIRALRPDVETGYIKPSAPEEAPRVVRAADLSFVSEPAALAALDAAAADLGVRHQVVLMVELGDLREGVTRDALVDAAGAALRHEHLELVGLGTNLNCLNGVLPSEDKLIQLPLYREIIELRHGVALPLLSAGTSVTLPLLFAGGVPDGINHFRIGEALFFGRDLLRGETFDGFADDVFRLEARVLEVADKPTEPSGELGEDPFGGRRRPALPSGDTARRAILDVGYLDADPRFLIPEEEGVEIVDASSDMLVVDVSARRDTTRVGERLAFGMRYMGALKLMNSPYVEKRVIGRPAAIRDVPPRGHDRPAEPALAAD